MTPHRRAPSHQLRPSRGFTLVELLVALTGGIIVSMTVYLLAQGGTRFYQREARNAEATMAVTMGFQRLRAELQRAGFLSTPNIQRDPTLCSTPVAGTFEAGLSSLQLTDMTAGAPIEKHRIRIAGALNSNVEFAIRGVVPDGALNSFVVLLQPNMPAVRRAGAFGVTDADDTTALEPLFRVNDLLRLVDETGRAQFARITAFTVNGGEPQISVTGNLQLRAGAAVRCGLSSPGTGLANVVNVVHYDIQNLAGVGAFQFLANANNPGEQGRTELVRTEIDASTGLAFPNTVPQLIAELAVGLRVDALIRTPGQRDRQLMIDPAPLTTLGDVAVAASMPETVQAVRVRLSVRNRDAERDSALVANNTNLLPGGAYRWLLPNGKFTRVHTIQSEITLHNQTGLPW